MRRLRRDGDDRGAVAVIVTILIGAVLLGMGALVVDVGQIYAERAQLQNGADAGALAVAQGCARSASNCVTSTAGSYADENSNDGKSSVDLVCGRDPYGKLASCPAVTSGALSCPTTPAYGTNYAEVHTSTLTSGGSTLLPPVFGRALLGSSYDGKTVHSCAQATWGAPAAARGLAMTISWCEWNSYTSGGTNYVAPPPYVPPAGADQVIYFHDTDPNPTHCTAGPSGYDVPGDFGATNSDGNCQTLFNFDASSGSTSYTTDPGSSLPADCETALQTAQQNHTAVFIPVYDRLVGTGSNGTYTLWTMAAFVVTGYFWPDWKAKSWLTNKFPCGGNQRCVSGYFSTGVTTGSLGSGSGAGVTVVQLTG